MFLAVSSPSRLAAIGVVEGFERLSRCLMKLKLVPGGDRFCGSDHCGYRSNVNELSGV